MEKLDSSGDLPRPLDGRGDSAPAQTAKAQRLSNTRPLALPKLDVECAGQGEAWKVAGVATAFHVWRSQDGDEAFWASVSVSAQDVRWNVRKAQRVYHTEAAVFRWVQVDTEQYSWRSVECKKQIIEERIRRSKV